MKKFYFSVLRFFFKEHFGHLKGADDDSDEDGQQGDENRGNQCPSGVLSRTFTEHLQCSRPLCYRPGIQNPKDTPLSPGRG